MTAIDITTLTRDEKSILLYAETCVVDRSGLMVGARMNEVDMAALKKFKEAGALDFGRIPYHCMQTLRHDGPGVESTHWVTFHEPAWKAAHALRRVRAQQIGPNRKKVDEALAERVAANPINANAGHTKTKETP